MLDFFSPKGQKAQQIIKDLCGSLPPNEILNLLLDDPQILKNASNEKKQKLRDLLDTHIKETPTNTNLLTKIQNVGVSSLKNAKDYFQNNFHSDETDINKNHNTVSFKEDQTPPNSINHKSIKQDTHKENIVSKKSTNNHTKNKTLKKPIPEKKIHKPFQDKNLSNKKNIEHIKEDINQQQGPNLKDIHDNHKITKPHKKNHNKNLNNGFEESKNRYKVGTKDTNEDLTHKTPNPQDQRNKYFVDPINTNEDLTHKTPNPQDQRNKYFVDPINTNEDLTHKTPNPQDQRNKYFVDPINTNEDLTHKTPNPQDQRNKYFVDPINTNEDLTHKTPNPQDQRNKYFVDPINTNEDLTHKTPNPQDQRNKYFVDPINTNEDLTHKTPNPQDQKDVIQDETRTKDQDIFIDMEDTTDNFPSNPFNLNQ